MNTGKFSLLFRDILRHILQHKGHIDWILNRDFWEEEKGETIRRTNAKYKVKGRIGIEVHRV